MKKLIVLVSLVTVIVLLGITLGCSQAAPSPSPTAKPAATPTATPSPTAAKTFKWINQQIYAGTGWPMTAGLGFMFAEQINKMSGGRLVIENQPPDAVVPTKDVFAAVSKGTVDMSVLYYAGYHSGLMPEADIEVGLPYAWGNPGEIVDAMENYGLKQKFQAIYAEQNVYWQYIASNYIYGLGTTFPITSPDDLKGKKVRAVGIYGEWVKAFGGAPVTIPWSESYMAFKLGTMDAGIMSPESLQSIKLEEVLKYYVSDPNPSVLTASFIINQNSLKALPADVQDMVKYLAASMGSWYSLSQVRLQRDYLNHFMNTFGGKEVSLTGAARDKAISAAISTWDIVAAKNPRNKELVDIVKKHVKDLGKIK